MSITKNEFGRLPSGEQVYKYNFKNKNNIEVSIINYGGIIVSIKVPDKNGKVDDVVLGLDNIDGYLGKHPYFGALIGRHGNRIENAEFELNGINYKLAKNDGNNNLHGGLIGFDKVLWHAEIIEEDKIEALQLTYRSVDMEEGFPGNLDIKVIYSLTEDNELKIDYFANTDKDTICNLTNHSYFNLSGHESGDILSHELKIYADTFTVVNDECIPTGEIRTVKDSPMDFTTTKKIGPGLVSGHEQITAGNGYDHNWVLKNCGDKLGIAAEVYDPKSGRKMEVYTTKPGMQFYSGNFIDGTLVGKDGVVYHKNNGLCLETQFYPNALKHRHFPTPILKVNENYHHTTIYRFI